MPITLRSLTLGSRRRQHGEPDPDSDSPRAATRAGVAGERVTMMRDGVTPELGTLDLNLKQVAVVGCGRMGCAIAGELARRGASVTMYDHTEFTRTRALQTLQASIAAHIGDGLLLRADAPLIMERVRVADTLEESVRLADIVIEAVIDELVLKQELFRSIGAAAPGSTLLTSNTISLTVSDIAKGAGVRVWGCRFLHPVWFVDEIEVTRPAGYAAGAASWSFTNRSRSDVLSIATCNASNDALSPALCALGFVPHYYVAGRSRRRLDEQRAAEYVAAQRAAVDLQQRADPDADPPPEMMNALMRISRGKHASGADGAGNASASSPARELERCAVCLEEPQGALLVPCGHTSTCVPCARALRPRICVECRRPIETILPLAQG